MGWFFATVLLYAHRPAIADRQGPFETKEACQIARIEILTVMRDLQATDCTFTPDKKARRR